MDDTQILYETNLAKTGRSLERGALVLLALGIVGLAACFAFGSFPDIIGPLLIAALFVFGLFRAFLKASRLRRNSGYYRIFIDPRGLNVHSDDTVLGPSFSIPPSDLHRLVRKGNGDFENTRYMYYIEEKSGRRHQVDEMLESYNLDVMALFRTITDRFPSVTVVDE